MRIVAILACALTVCITAASAFIRHSQSGLGCEGWPDCYRQAVSSATGAASRDGPDATVQSRALRTPSSETDPAIRAVRMLHRVTAVAVGLVVLGMLLFGWRTADRSSRFAIAFALLVTVLLSWLGRLTPHDLPAVAIGNVLGGFALSAAFGWVAGRPTVRGRGANPGRPMARGPGAGSGRIASWTLFVILVALTCVGVLISVRHAVDGCASLACLPGSPTDWTVFDPRVVLTRIDDASARALHVAHNLTALVFVGLAGLLAFRLARAGRSLAASMVALSTIALTAFGATTAAGLAALASATAHNAVAALACAVLAGVAASSTRRGSTGSMPRGHPGR